MTHLSDFKLRLPRIDAVGIDYEPDEPAPAPEPRPEPKVRAHSDEYDQMRDYILMVDLYVTRLRELLPGPKKDMDVFETLEAFEGAVKDISTLLSASIDYRNLLIRANVPDSVSGRHDGVDAICERYGVVLSKRSQYGEELYHAVIKNTI